MMEIDATTRAPGQMLGDQARLDDVGEAPEAVEMMPIERTGRAERETHPVKRDRIVAAHGLEGGEGPGVGHVVLRVHLDPGDGGTPGQELAHVPSPEPDARERLLTDHDARTVPERSGARLRAAADELVAGAGGHVDPGVLLAVAPRGARAGRVGGLAVVLAGLGDAVALLGLELGLRSGAGLTIGGQVHGQRSDHGGCDQQVLVHLDSPLALGLITTPPRARPARHTSSVARLDTGGGQRGSPRPRRTWRTARRV